MAHEGSPYLFVVELSTLSVVQRPFVGSGQTAIRIDRASDRVYLARRGTGTIEVFDPMSLLAIDRLPVSGEVAYMTLDRETASLVAVLPKEGKLERISPVSRSIEGVVATGLGARFVALVGER